MTPRFLIAAAIATVSTVAPAAAQDRTVEAQRAVFDICPEVFAGRISLADPAQIPLGYRMTAPRDTPGGAVPRAEWGEGVAKIVIAGHAGDKPACTVWIGGPDTNQVLKTVLRDARKIGFSMGRPVSLGDGTPIAIAKRAGSPATMTIIFADAGGELDSAAAPAATIIFMN